ncbi:MAG: hypothetical protein NC091_00045 [Bacteroides sp.]|nr:hypothetical protein [Bacteroides sp.]
MSLIKDDYKYEPFEDETFKHMPTADGISSMVESNYLLGQSSGKIEWTQQPDKAKDTFIHLSSYEHFIDANQLILLGRTGSGKSSIIYGLKNDIQESRISRYSDAIQIDERDFCEKLAEMCYDIDINRFDATNKITSAVVMTIYTRVMIYCCETFKDNRNQLRQITRYLIANNFIATNVTNLSEILNKLSSDDYEKHIEDIYKNDIIGTAFSVAKLLSKTCEILKKNDDNFDNMNEYEKAFMELREFLRKNNKKILVLLDSFDEYKINDKAFVIAIKSLILACFKIFCDSVQNNIFFKMALASEVYTRVLANLPAQNHTNTVAILWSYKDLIKCMALRFVSWYHDPDAPHIEKRYLFNFLSKYKVTDLKESKIAYETAEEIFLNILPKICKTNSAYKYLSLAFISRHTMKKPREIMQIFNAILDRIIHEDNSSYFLQDNNSLKLKDIVHSLQNDFIEQTLSIYRIFIPNIDNYINDLLYNRNFIFSLTDKDFKEKLKEVNAHIQSEVSENEYLYYWKEHDIISIVFETGLLGKVSRVRTIDVTNIEQFGFEGDIKIIDALFEYQFKGRIQKNNNIQYVIHPMCYEHFNCNVGTRSMVNTDSFDTTELLSSVLIE